jgi:hypothetical protein
MLRILAWSNRLFFQLRSTSNPPRARSPVTYPLGHADGSAGNNSISPV